MSLGENEIGFERYYEAYDDLGLANLSLKIVQELKAVQKPRTETVDK